MKNKYEIIDCSQTKNCEGVPIHYISDIHIFHLLSNRYPDLKTPDLFEIAIDVPA